MNILYFFMNLPLFGIGIAFLIQKNNNVNLCINCKHFLPYTFFTVNNEFAKCALYKQIKYDETYLVTSNTKKEEIDYYYCKTCRRNETMCGKEGKNFVSKYKK
jgi:hypothetical protein